MKKNGIFIGKRIILFVLFVVLVSDFAIVFYVNDVLTSQHPYKYAPQYKGESLYSIFIEVFLAPFAYLWRWVTDPHVVTALATIVIAAYTYVLAGATIALKRMAKQQEDTVKAHERAYIILGPPFGTPKPKGFLQKIFRANEPQVEMPNKSDNFIGPWRMVFHNYGRTPAFVTEIKWGMCRKEAFREDVLVSEIVKNPKTYLPTDSVFEIPPYVDEAYPPTTKPILNRHVEIKRRTPYIGWVFFARVAYKDVFGDPHHSTCKILLTDSHSEPLNGCHSQDKN